MTAGSGAVGSAAVASMTGAGTAAGPTGLGELRVEARSVNGRALVVKHRLCPELAGVESELEERVRTVIHRGTVTLQVDRADAAFGALSDLPALQTLAERLRQAARGLGLPEELSLRDLLAVAGSLPRPAGGAAELPADVAALVDRALAALVARRRAEGRTTAAAMTGHLDELERQLQVAVARAPEVVAAHREKLLRRLQDFVQQQGSQLEAADLVREVALFAERVDVSEEVQRLHAHLAAVRATLAAGGEVGRRLEFLLQEVLRETNTLGSKSPDVTMSHAAVAMKSCIDKLKEQAANLE